MVGLKLCGARSNPSCGGWWSSKICIMGQKSRSGVVSTKDVRQKQLCVCSVVRVIVGAWLCVSEESKSVRRQISCRDMFTTDCTCRLLFFRFRFSLWYDICLSFFFSPFFCSSSFIFSTSLPPFRLVSFFFRTAVIPLYRPCVLVGLGSSGLL